MAAETWWPTITPLPSITPWPTATSFPSGTPYPSITPYPTYADDDGYITDDISGKLPLNALDESNNDNVDSRVPPPAPENENDSNPLGNLIQDFMNEKKATYTPTITPLPSITPFPTVSAFPSLTAYPTRTDEKDYESVDTEGEAIPSSPVAPIAPSTPTEKAPVNSPTLSPTIKKINDQPHNVPPEGSIGHSRICDGYVPSATQVTTRVIFTYLIESISSSFDFLTEMELHLLDHVAAEALQCKEEADRVLLYEIAYPDDVAATESSSCEPESPGASSCWIFQTDMLITTEQPSVVAAKSNMLFFLRNQLDGGALLTDSFPDFVVARYLGPDLVGSTFEGTEYTNVVVDDDTVGSSGDDAASSSHVLSLVATVCVSLAAASVCLFVVTYCYYRDRRQKQHQNVILDAHMRESNIHPHHPSHHYPGKDMELGSVTDLLRKSKERLETIPISPLGNESVTNNGGPSTNKKSRFFSGFRRNKQQKSPQHIEGDLSHLLSESARRTKAARMNPTTTPATDYGDEESTSRDSWEKNRVFVRTEYASDSSTGIVSNKSKSSRSKKKKKRPTSKSTALVSGNSGRRRSGRNQRSSSSRPFMPPESPRDGTTTISNLSGESWEDETQQELLRERARRQVKRERPKILKTSSDRGDRAASNGYSDGDDHVNLDPRFEII